MNLTYYQVDAFTSQLFRGNPAGVVFLEDWLPDETMQAIAHENALAETAFVVRTSEHYQIRWFTPTYEIDLCGHATLATAWLLFYHLKQESEVIYFHSPKSGELSARQIPESKVQLNFPVRKGAPVPIPEGAEKAFGFQPVAAFLSRDMLLIFESQAQIEQLSPVPEHFKNWNCLGVICTAQGDSVDFVSRVFDANDYHLEDPVTGSAHCTLAPYWAERLEKDQFNALQLSQRQGELLVEIRNNRVMLTGEAVLYLEGKIQM